MEQRLSQQMLHSLDLLQETNIQLEQRISRELLENPFLETDDSPADHEPEDEKEPHAEDHGELDLSEDSAEVPYALEEGLQYSDDGDGGISQEEQQEKREYWHSLQTYESSLEEHLRTQLREKSVSQKIWPLMEFILGSLDERGYLQIPTEEICAISGFSLEMVQDGIALLQSLEPAGVGARDLQECLLLQLARTHGTDSVEYQIVDSYWQYFEKLQLPRLARELALSIEEVTRAKEVIASLDPKPGMQYSLSDSDEYAPPPDLRVIKHNGRWKSVLNDSFLPDLRISEQYSDQLRYRSDEKSVKKFLREKRGSAQWLIMAVEQRKRSMLKVMDAIVAHQNGFFDQGDENALRPLTLKDIAQEVELHPSTVSRVTNNKFVETPYGVYELKYFFVASMGGGTEVANIRIQNLVRDLIAEEDRKKPLSDQKIANLLKERGVEAARRTVAKYRDKLGIPTARLRKEHA
ncbi:RNA polymerase sigma-54 subunit [Chitinivibrio alkaliphilus ACht1]|uniref:RNA polymerase sigma-54 subunit n=2 Tax=Chitinivibrio TaxID=1505231 RepID=U7D7L5_9BACT|nr:RNA polymerase sigma-54 subunit [Chitinivibrio alkaliphilus ACht1]